MFVCFVDAVAGRLTREESMMSSSKVLPKGPNRVCHRLYIFTLRPVVPRCQALMALQQLIDVLGGSGWGLLSSSVLVLRMRPFSARAPCRLERTHASSCRQMSLAVISLLLVSSSVLLFLLPSPAPGLSRRPGVSHTRPSGIHLRPCPCFVFWREILL